MLRATDDSFRHDRRRAVINLWSAFREVDLRSGRGFARMEQRPHPWRTGHFRRFGQMEQTIAVSDYSRSPN